MEVMIYAILSVNNESQKLDSLLMEMKGISGADLNVVSFNEIAAVTSDIVRTNLVADSSNALVYAKIIETLSHQFPLLPMRFGSVMESTEVIFKMLERNYTEVQQNLQKVENKIEFGLKVFCDSGKLKEKLTEKSMVSPDPLIVSDSTTNISVFRAYVNRKLEAHRLEELVLGHVDALITLITEKLLFLDALCKFRKMLTEKTIIDGVFLLGNDKKQELILVIEQLQNQYPELNFILTGPWPPYNFVETTIK